MSLIRTSMLSAIATAIRILTSVGLNKVLAVYVGPAGYALFGQFSNFVTIASAFGGGAVSTGVTKYTAEHYDDELRKKEIWRIAFYYIIAISFIISLIISWNAQTLSIMLLGTNDYKSIFYLLSISTPLISINLLLVAIVNGQKELSNYIYQSIAASLLGAALSSVLAIRFGLWGALAALSVNQGVVLVTTLAVVRKSQWLKMASFIGKIKYKNIRPIAGFVLMALFSSITAPLSQLIIRNNIVEKFGEVSAGEWQAVFKISEIYLIFITSTLSVYYLPRISEIRDNQDLKKEIFLVYRVMLPVAILMACLIYIFRDFITVTLFTSDFIGMTQLFAPQLFGDVMKIGSWILGFVMVARGMVRWFLITEIFFSCTLIALTFSLTGLIGLRGAPAAFAVNYILYWIFLIWLMRKKIP